MVLPLMRIRACLAPLDELVSALYVSCSNEGLYHAHFADVKIKSKAARDPYDEAI